MYKFLLWGYYGAGNFGDEIMKIVIIRELQARFKGCFITVRCDGVGTNKIIDGIQYIFFRGGILRFFTKFNMLLHLLLSHDVLLIGGGTFLGRAKERSWKSHLWYFMFIVLSKLLKRKIFFISVGIGKIWGPGSKIFVKLFLRYVDGCFAREKKSYEDFSILAGTKRNIFLTGDVVSLYCVEDHGCNSKKQSQKEFGVSLMPYFSTYVKDFEREELLINDLAKYFDELIEKYCCRLIFFCLQATNIISDKSFSEKVILKMKKKDFCEIFVSTNYEKMVFRIESMSFFVGMRLHAILFALRKGIPTVAISVNAKIDNIMSEYGIENLCVEVNCVSSVTLMNLTRIAVANPFTEKETLEHLVYSLTSAKKNFEILKECLAKIK